MLKKQQNSTSSVSYHLQCFVPPVEQIYQHKNPLLRTLDCLETHDISLTTTREVLNKVYQDVEKSSYYEIKEIYVCLNRA